MKQLDRIPVIGQITKRLFGHDYASLIREALTGSTFTSHQARDEASVRKRLVKILEQQEGFEHVEIDHPIEGGGKVDIAVGPKQDYAIEVKLLRCLRTLQQRRLLYGQLNDYRDRYDGNLMLIVVGNPDGQDAKHLAAIKRRTHEQYVEFFFMPTK